RDSAPNAVYSVSQKCAPTCAERGEAPDKPYSGKFNIRIPPELHAKAASKAQSLGESLNDFVRKAIEDEVSAGAVV
ncbi:MAG: type II toxin-antitoxin system HicB family antitoxin, partial [Rectinemataceae bacterium]